MIKKEVFVQIIEDNCRFFDQIIKLAEMRIELWDTTLVKSYDNTFRSYMFELFGEEGLDWIEWYCYTKHNNKHLIARDKDGNEICDTPEKLYDFLVSEHYGDIQRDELD